MSGQDITASQSGGVYLLGSLANPVTVEPGVQITNTTGYGYGIASLLAVNWTVANHGTIIGNVPDSHFSDGILFDQANADIINSSAGYIYGARSGVYSYQGGTVTNAGTIAGDLAGVYTFGPTTITNDGRLSGQTAAGAVLIGGGSINNQTHGVIIGGYDGIFGAGANPTTVVNSGSAIGASYAGVLLRSGGSLINQTPGFVYGSSFGAHIAVPRPSTIPARS